MKVFECYYCKETLPIEDAKGEITGVGRGKCRPCHSRYTREHQARKRAEKNPENYMTCDDCDKIFHKSRRVKGFYKESVLHKNCPKCKSENIQPY